MDVNVFNQKQIFLLLMEVCIAAMITMAPSRFIRAQDAPKPSRVPVDDWQVRNELTGDFQMKAPSGSQIGFWDLTMPQWLKHGEPLTRALLLKDLPIAGHMDQLFIPRYVVESSNVRIDKLVVFGDTALVLTTGTGAGTLNDLTSPEASPTHKHWSSLKYRDCEAWIKTPEGWKLREVYLLAFVPDSWRLHESHEKYLPPYLGF